MTTPEGARKGKWNFTAEDVRAKFIYEPDAGILRLRSTGEAAGRFNHEGYRVVDVHCKKQLAHRVAWMIVHGALPSMLDHINGDRSDNRLSNLRPANRRINSENTIHPRPANRVGLTGVSETNGRYSATIKTNGRSIYLGTFADKEAAHQAYLDAKAKLHEGWSIGIEAMEPEEATQ